MKKQVYLTPAEGKRLIAKAVAEDGRVRKAIEIGTLVIVSGTTNGYIVEELSERFGIRDFDKNTFYRGIYMGPEGKTNSKPRDIVIRNGQFLSEEDIYTIAPTLTKDDVILKGGNAVYLPRHEVGVVIGHPEYGTMAPISAAVYGRRATLLMPIGLEKRVEKPISELAAFVNDPEMPGTRMGIAPGKAYTELDAFESLGLEAVLLAGGGVGGFEGSVLIGLSGDKEGMEKADKWVRSARGEARFGK